MNKAEEFKKALGIDIDLECVYKVRNNGLVIKRWSDDEINEMLEVLAGNNFRMPHGYANKLALKFDRTVHAVRMMSYRLRRAILRGKDIYYESLGKKESQRGD